MLILKSNNKVEFSFTHQMKHLTALTGAGMSAESGLKTFRDADGLWEGHDVMAVASPEGFRTNPELVLEFYNQRRRQLKEVKPNSAHYALAALEKNYKVSIVTQNVDDLHERAGSSNVVHLHGELLKSRNIIDDTSEFECMSDIKLGDLCPNGHQLRPHIVWFGEAVPMIEAAMEICENADLLLIVGTSMQVYPAAGLIHYAPQNTPIYFIDPKPSIQPTNNLIIISKTATKGMKTFMELLG